MKNIIIIILILIIGCGAYLFNDYRKTYNYACAEKANLMGVQGWECHSSNAAAPEIKGISAPKQNGTQ